MQKIDKIKPIQTYDFNSLFLDMRLVLNSNYFLLIFACLTSWCSSSTSVSASGSGTVFLVAVELTVKSVSALCLLKELTKLEINDWLTYFFWVHWCRRPVLRISH